MQSIDDDADPVASQKALRSRKASLPLLGSVILLSLVYIWMSVWIIPRFTAIFRDMLGNRPPPILAAIVINSRWVLVILDCVLCPSPPSLFGPQPH